jgi:hypothetical protein
MNARGGTKKNKKIGGAGGRLTEAKQMQQGD